MLFLVEKVFLEQEVHYYTVYIAYYTELILQFSKKNDAIVGKIVFTRLTKKLIAIFAPATPLSTMKTKKKKSEKSLV